MPEQGIGENIQHEEEEEEEQIDQQVNAPACGDANC
jgi:hypothetical protein